MEEGSLRCDANISLRPHGQTTLGTKAEIKNLNSFRSVQRGIEYEVIRQEEILDDGGRVIQETRTWDENKGITASMRNKEQAHDYRYLPEPDLVPIVVDPAKVEDIRANLPELPDARKQRLMNDHGLSDYDASIITASKAVADYFDQSVQNNGEAKAVANWLMGEVSKHLNSEGITILECPVSPKQLTELLALIEKGTISSKIAKTVFEEMWSSRKDAEVIVKEKSVADYKAGKDKAIGFLVGQIMKQTKGRANPDMVNTLLRERL